MRKISLNDLLGSLTLKNKRILVTGGSGFIGTNFIEILKNKDIEILNIDIKPPRIKEHNQYWKKVNILDRNNLLNSFNDFKPELVIHLAARTDLDGKTVEDYKSNTVGVSKNIEAVKYCKSVKITIFTSSMLVCKVG